MHVPRKFRTLFEMHVHFSLFIDYKAINYRTYGDNLEVILKYIAPFASENA
jgi:hypothetical protein